MEQQVIRSRRVTPHMVLAGLILTYNIGTFYGCCVPSLINNPVKLIALTASFSVATALLILSTVGTACIDPHYRPTPSATNSFPRRKNKTQHDILAYCKKCRQSFEYSTKHCRECDRCTDGFDHHCKWIGRCIGSRNFKWFIWLIGSSFAHLVLYIAAGLTMALSWNGTSLASLVLLSVGTVVSFVMACLNFYLIIYQIYEHFKLKKTRSGGQMESLSRIYPMNQPVQPPELPKSRRMQRQQTEPEEQMPTTPNMDQLQLPINLELKNNSMTTQHKSEQPEEYDKGSEFVSPRANEEVNQ